MIKAREFTNLFNIDITKIFAEDSEKFKQIQNILFELISYNTLYGISIDNIEKHGNDKSEVIEFSITVPEHSELKSDREFELCGIYLANLFKTKVTNSIEKIYKLFELQKIPRIKIKYTSTIDSKFTHEKSLLNNKELEQKSESNSMFPFEEWEVF